MKTKEFEKYIYKFYGPTGIYAEFFDHCLNFDIIKRAIRLRKQIKSVQFCSDSFDRELIRDIMFVLLGKTKNVEYPHILIKSKTIKSLMLK